jgi:DNA-binding GntR family transcriptional regulator
MKVALDASDLQELLQLNRKFHTGIYAAAKEGRLLDLINNYFDQAEVYRRIFVNLDHSREEMVNHREVLVALGDHDSVLAEKLTRDHLRKTAEKLTDFFSAKLE